jgi:hypothetical protein
MFNEWPDLYIRSDLYIRGTLIIIGIAVIALLAWCVITPRASWLEKISVLLVFIAISLGLNFIALAFMLAAVILFVVDMVRIKKNKAHSSKQ